MRSTSVGFGPAVWFVGCLGALACSGEANEDGAPDSPLPTFGAGAAGMPSNGAATSGVGGAGSGLTGTPETNGSVPLQPGGSTLPGQPAQAGGASSGGGGSAGDSTGGPTGTPPSLENVLVFTRTTGFRHDSIAAGVQALVTLGDANGFAVEQTEDPIAFSDAGLSEYDVVVWLSTTADVLDAEQQAAFERYIRAGGGWVGVHSASDTEYDWPWYGQLLGGDAYFRIHPAIQTAELNVEEGSHPSTAHLPATFSMEDEWYNFQANPRASVSVLMTLNESTYVAGEGAMTDHPIAWYHEFDGGRAWYTALGHRQELYQDPRFTQHLLGGIRWVAGVAP
jgi:cytochrome c